MDRYGEGLGVLGELQGAGTRDDTNGGLEFRRLTATRVDPGRQHPYGVATDERRNDTQVLAQSLANMVSWCLHS